MANELPSSVQKDSIDWELEAVGEDGEEINGTGGGAGAARAA